VADARTTVFGPHPILGITIERRGAGDDDIHVHPGGQGVWVARMAGEMDAYPVLCGFQGGETGTLLAGSGRHLLVDQDASASPVTLTLTGSDATTAIPGSSAPFVGLVRIR